MDRDMEAGGDVLDFRQAQDFLNTTRTTLYRWIAQGRIKAFKAGRQWRMYRADLERFLESPDPAGSPADEEAVEAAVEAVMGWAPEGAAGGELPLGASPDDARDGVASLAHRVLLAAVMPPSSDVHLDPSRSGGRLRLRIDGVLRTVTDLPRDVFAALVGRLKLLAGMDIADRASAQMGRIQETLHGGHALSAIVQSLPTPLGEKLSLRIVSESLLDLSLGDLGMSDPDRERLERALVQPTGIIIFGGPTGSGKTTVLYSAVMHAQSDENAVITVESTVYHLLPGAVQVQTNPRAGLSVANALQSVMRADPDIIAIGDVPDRESANLAVEAGLTGHLVLVQLHANDALGNIQRVLDAGIEPFLFGHSLIASVNQRLVRKVCEHCREKLPVDDETVSAWRRRAEAGGLEWQADATFVQGAGCERCRGVGFWRQTALFEVLAVEPEVASLIAQGADLEAVHAAGVAGGMTTLFADGIRKALEGITSPIEVARVCDPAWMSV